MAARRALTFLEQQPQVDPARLGVYGHSMGGKVAMLFATIYPDYVDKLIIADIGPKYYAPHHQTILAALNAIDFSKKPSRGEVDNILSSYISDFGTKQFLLKNVYWETPDQLNFRFNLPVFNLKISEIGLALPIKSQYFKATLFLRGSKSDYILDEDFDTILHHFPKAKIHTISEAGHWLHVENPSAFYYEIKQLNLFRIPVLVEILIIH
jgi:pimeloyl-ACP methyl ester carboxylesterase